LKKKKIVMKVLCLKISHVIALGLGALFITWFILESTGPYSCTIFTAVQGGTVLFGDNFDYHMADLVIGFTWILLAVPISPGQAGFRARYWR
jgi:hypothetical protein